MHQLTLVKFRWFKSIYLFTACERMQVLPYSAFLLPHQQQSLPFSLYKHTALIISSFSGILGETQRYPPAHSRTLHIHIRSKVWGYSPSVYREFRPQDTLSTKKRLWNLWMPNRNHTSHGTFCIPHHSRSVFVSSTSCLPRKKQFT